MEFIEIVKSQITTPKLRKLIRFIRKEFPSNESLNSEQQWQKFEYLKQLSDKDITSGIAKMARIESGFFYSKYTMFILCILSLSLGSLKFIFMNTLPIGSEVYFIYMIVCVFTLLSAVILDIRVMTTAMYFKTLLEQAKADKKNEKESLPSSQIEVKIFNVWPFWKKNTFYIKQAKSLEEVLFKWNNKEIASYISDRLGYWSTNKKAELQRIRGLDIDTIILAIARMKDIEEYFDNSKIVPGLTSVSTLFVTYIVYYFAYTNEGKPTMASVSIGVMFSVGIFYGITYGMDNSRTCRSRAIQYRSLLEQVKSEIEKK
ncbi:MULTISPECIES: hypothetical protein [Bacillus]|nr:MULTISPECIES: hypothetical protein [Bacillus]MCY0089178.1 hypothetical protein [Bacillus velezensis]MDZ7434152.1 hypothetical protein [Bacillus amyloliquefaciens]MEC1018555.1 hypothetical protein [Bacillus velezensis]UHD39893.1 hypothetical protein LUX28_11495 [Bacillus velezensis]UTQ07126.1 hypothetical protein NMK97_11450 [Bacillus amyloliquefaciens]